MSTLQQVPSVAIGASQTQTAAAVGPRSTPAGASTGQLILPLQRQRQTASSVELVRRTLHASATAFQNVLHRLDALSLCVGEAFVLFNREIVAHGVLQVRGSMPPAAVQPSELARRPASARGKQQEDNRLLRHLTPLRR